MAKSKRSSLRKKMLSLRLRNPEFKEKMRKDLENMLASTNEGGIDMYVEPDAKYEPIHVGEIDLEVINASDDNLIDDDYANYKIFPSRKHRVGKLKRRMKKRCKKARN